MCPTNHHQYQGNPNPKVRVTAIIVGIEQIRDEKFVQVRIIDNNNSLNYRDDNTYLLNDVHLATMIHKQDE